MKTNSDQPAASNRALPSTQLTGAIPGSAWASLQACRGNQDMNQSVGTGRRNWLQQRLHIILVAPLLVGLCATAAHAQVPANPYNYSRTTSFTYDGTTGFVSTQTVEPSNAPSCVLTTYGYDSYGNKKSVTTANCANASGGSFPSRTTSTSYTAPALQTITVRDNNNVASNVAVSYPSGLVPTALTNALLQNETRQFDPRFGTATLLTGPNGLNTIWVLDDFGRKIKESLADGTGTAVYYCVLATSTLDTSSNTPACPTPGASEIPADAVAFVHSEPRDSNNVKMGAFSRVYSDRLGRTIRTATESFDGTNQPNARSGVAVVQDIVYNVYGAKIIETQPYFLASSSSTTGGSNNVGASLINLDVLGRPTTVFATDPKGQAGSQGYGAYGTQISAKTSYAYAGLTVTITNDKGQIRTEEKNAIGEMVRVTDASGAQLAHQRDAFGNLITTKDALQNTIALVYDIAGRKTQMNDPDAGVWGYCYDALGELVAQQNSAMRGNDTPGACPSNPNSGATANSITGWTTLAYDKVGRPTQRVEPEFTSTWTYDQYADYSACNKGVGKLCQVVTSNGVNRKVVYDGVGRPVNSLTTTGAGPSFASAVAYDPNTGRVTSQTYPTGLQVGYVYTARGYFEKLTLLTAATVNPLPVTAGGTPGPGASLSSGTLLWQAQIVNAWNVTERQYYGNGVIANAAYEAATGRATDITAGVGTSTTVLSHHYTWDSLSNLVGRSDANGDGGSSAVTETFTYGDSLNRLTGYTVAAPAIAGLSRNVSLQYNALGMLLYKSDVGVYAYGAQGPGNARPHALLTVSGASGTTNGYDANGNLTSATTGKYRSISYTSFNLPDSQSGIKGPGGTPQYTWVYDDSHSRVKEVRTVTGGPNADTRTVWYMHPDNEGGLGFEREDSNAGSSNRHFLSAAGQAIGVLVSTASLPTLTATQTAPTALSTITLVKVEYWHKDHLGSLAATTDHAGGVTARYAYDPFGKRRYTNGNYDAFGNLVIDWSSTVNSGTSRGFTGHEDLDDIGLVHMNGRIFDPTLGVFLQADPHVTDAGNLQSYNRYGYCVNNPMTCTDPSGFNYVDEYGAFWIVGDGGFSSPNLTGGGTYPGSDAIYTYQNPAQNLSPYVPPPPQPGAVSIPTYDQMMAQSQARLDQVFQDMEQQLRQFSNAGIPPVPSPAPITNDQGTSPGPKYAAPQVTGATAGMAGAGARTAVNGHIPWTLGDAYRTVDNARAAGTFKGPYIGDVLSDDSWSFIFRTFFGASRGEAEAASLAVGFINPAGWVKGGLRGVAKVGEEALFGLCFVAGTPVLTQEGLKPIERIREGDLVAARDENTGATLWRPVLRLFHNAGQDIVQVTYVDERGDEETVGASLEHPFMVMGRGWVGASSLLPGDNIGRLDQGLVTVRRVVRDLSPRDTYNFEVAETHSYFVGTRGVWVHNASVSGLQSAAKELPAVVKAVNSNLDHAVKRAVARGVLAAGEAANALRSLSTEIGKTGWPAGSVLDSARVDRVLVPIGEAGMAAYQVGKNGTAKLKTVLNALID